MSTFVFISGSRSIKTLPFEALESLEAIMAQGFTVLVGDCFGVDTLVQDYLAERHYPNVIVCHIGTRPRNNRGFKTHQVAGTRQTDKDAYMGQTANYGLAIWDGVSPGTAKNIDRVKSKVIKVSSSPPQNLRFISGNMFDVPADIRINTVNCVGVMGAGVALAFKRLHPLMFAEYQRKCRARLILPGQLHVLAITRRRTYRQLPHQTSLARQLPIRRHSSRPDCSQSVLSRSRTSPRYFARSWLRPRSTQLEGRRRNDCQTSSGTRSSNHRFPTSRLTERRQLDPNPTTLPIPRISFCQSEKQNFG